MGGDINLREGDDPEGLSAHGDPDFLPLFQGKIPEDIIGQMNLQMKILFG